MEGWTPLMLAAHGTDIAGARPRMISMLLDRGADPTIYYNGYDCLYKAASCGCDDAVYVMLASGHFNAYQEYWVKGFKRNIADAAHFCKGHLEQWLEDNFKLKRHMGLPSLPSPKQWQICMLTTSFSVDKL